MADQMSEPALGDIVTRGKHGQTEYRIWLVDGDIAIATSQATGIPHRVPLSSLRFVRHVDRPGFLA